MAAASINTVIDAADSSGDYWSVGGAFLFGGGLGFLLAPKWKVGYTLASKEGAQGDDRRQKPGGGFWGKAGGGDGAGSRGLIPGPNASVSSMDGLSGGGNEYWRPVLEDSVPLKERANAIVGAAAVLYASLGFWLLAK